MKRSILAFSTIVALAIQSFAYDIWNPASGVYILQLGDLYQGDTVSGNLFYTRYNSTVTDRVKRVTFRYNGLGYFRLENKTTIANTNGADGIIHHPDGDLLVGGQNAYLHKVRKSDGVTVKSVTDSNNLASRFGIYHVMMDPDNQTVWAAGIPGYLFRFPARSDIPDNLGAGVRVPLRGDDTLICTLAWDENGQTFYTSSRYEGYPISGYPSSFGWIDMNTMTTHRLMTEVHGAHGMTYDSYSKTIFIFGGQRILQIDPISKQKVAQLSFDTLFSSIKHTFRFDQGTVDGKGHLYVADNNGYLVFVDYTSNPNKRIDNNILIHVQFLDNELDDVAPLSGAGSEVKKTTTSSGSGGYLSSGGSGTSSNQYLSSSSRPSSSSVMISSSGGASSSGVMSSSGALSSGGGSSSALSSGGTGSSGAQSSSGTGNSSGTLSSGASSTGTSSAGSSGSSSNNVGSSSGGGGDSSQSGGSSSSSGNSMSSGTGVSGSGGSVGDPSSSTGVSGSGGSVGDPSSSTGVSGSGGSIPDWADSTWDFGGIGGVIPDDGNEDDYPSLDKREIADSVVKSGKQLVPLQPGQPFNPADTVMIGHNAYVVTNTPGDPLSGFGPGSGNKRDSVPVGAVISLDLDIAKLKAFFGSGTDSIRVTGSMGLEFVNPKAGGEPQPMLVFPLDGSSDRLWVVSDTVMVGGYITFTSPSGKVLRYDGINFYDPIPDPEAGLLKDSDGDGDKDAIEVFLERALDTGYSIHSVDIRYNGKVLTVSQKDITLSADRTRFTVRVEGSGLANYTVQPSDILDIHFTDGLQVFDRKIRLQEVMSGIIARAMVIRGLNGRDSLFIEYNIDLSSQDLLLKNALIRLNGQEIQVDVVRQPGRRLIILEGQRYSWTGRDSVQLHELATFVNYPYIVEEEYARKVPVAIVNRIPPVASGSGYYDADGDGTMDSVVIRFKGPLTTEQLSMLKLVIPWYSYRNRLIQLMPAADELSLHPDDPSLVVWRVRSNVEMRAGLTVIPQGLPAAELYVVYPVFGNEFMEQRTVLMQDRMAPAIRDARLRYAEEADTLLVSFTEPVDYRKITRTDIFKYIHGGDTLILRPLQLIWLDDGKSVKVVMARGQMDPVVAGDFLMLRGDGLVGGEVPDMLGNTPERDSKPALIQGGLNHLVQSSNMGVLSARAMDTLAMKATVSIAFVDGQMRSRDMRERGKVGQLIELGQRFMPQLVDQAGIDPDSLDPSRVYITVSTYYFDNQGQYVADTVMSISCMHPAFGGNCLNTDKKMFIDWNFKDRRGRFVGSGVYIANFNLIIRYEGVTLKEERMERVGVRRTK